MKTCVMFCALLITVAAVKADTGFLKTLPAEDFAAAGLKKLTPEELARLETLVQQYKTGVVADVTQQVEAKAAVTRQEAEEKVAVAETKAQAAEAKARDAEVKANEAAKAAREAGAMTATPPAKKPPGWFSALIQLKRAGEKPEKEEPLVSQLVGDFNGWNGRSVFRLQDGTEWLQQNATEKYSYSPVLHSPKVKITPAAISGFWLEIEGVNLTVRVVPLKLTEQK